MSLYLESLQIRDFRIIEHADIRLSPTLNIFFGLNAAGKTSVLESIDILSRGRSFRSHKLEDILRRGANTLTVASDLLCPAGKVRLGVARSISSTAIRISGRDAKSVGESAALLPVSSLHPQSQELVLGSPAYRRSFLDFGLFHVEHDFYQTWRRYQRLLSQRNASLKQGATNLFAWDDSLAETGEAIGRMRQTYVTSLSARIIAIATRLLDREAVDIKYRPGWSDADGLRAALRKTELQDRARGFTGAGPHRAELEVFLAGRPAAQSASRGQLKLLVSALVVGQLEHLRDEAKVHAVVLIDELPAELDENSRTRLISLVGELGMQTFISAIDPESVEAQSWGDPSLFHVEQGRIAQVV